MQRSILSFFLLFAALPGLAQIDRIAFLADVHLHDIFGKFEDQEFSGVPHPKDKTPVLVRSMASQLRSTRIFNENYFALLAALEDIAKKGIKAVALPGDYTDDGQAYNLRGLKKILKEYSERHGIRFFITTGNHDPLGPFRQEGGKADFLDAEGKNFGIFSSGNKGIITADIAPSGYKEILEELHNFGFMPHEKDRFWATPFSDYTVQNYQYSLARNQAELSRRQYQILPNYWVPDFSYVVEATKDVWLLAIDGNTYIPHKADGNPADPKSFKAAGIGYNEVLTHKKHLIAWIEKITALAKINGKTLVAFSHYPAVDYNDHAAEEITALLGPTKWQLHRAPTEEVAQVLARAGLTLHFGGHMHINDTGIRKYADHRLLVNIQVPSLAAYIPAYKELKINSPYQFEVLTHKIDNVPGFNYLFPLYERELTYLKSTGNQKRYYNKLPTSILRDFTCRNLSDYVIFQTTGPPIISLPSLRGQERTGSKH
jgi:hypothetical protein